MQTLEIDLILDRAYHRAAETAAIGIRQHLRPFNLRRHPLSFGNYGLLVGDVRVYELTSRHPVVQALHEVARFVDSLPPGVQRRLQEHL